MSPSLVLSASIQRRRRPKKLNSRIYRHLPTYRPQRNSSGNHCHLSPDPAIGHGVKHGIYGLAARGLQTTGRKLLARVDQQLAGARCWLACCRALRCLPKRVASPIPRQKRHTGAESPGKPRPVQEEDGFSKISIPKITDQRQHRLNGRPRLQVLPRSEPLADRRPKRLASESGKNLWLSWNLQPRTAAGCKPG